MTISAYTENFPVFHLHNDEISYLIHIQKEGLPVNLYFGPALHDEQPDHFIHLYENWFREMSVVIPGSDKVSREHLRSEYPTAFTGDMRLPALDLEGIDHNRIVDFRYCGYEIMEGKPALPGLPSCYVEEKEEAETLILHLKDEVLQTRLALSYTLYKNRPVICRSVRICNEGSRAVDIQSIMSMSLDLPDDEYEMISLHGAWARERHIQCEPLHQGVQSIYSIRGHSGHNANPFLALKRPETTETSGEALGFSLVYSGNFQASVDVDAWHTTRIMMGIHPFTFCWKLEPGESFQAPEAVLVCSSSGLNGMSQAFHDLFQNRLARGIWKKEPRPILFNNWEGTYFDFDEEKIVAMARSARDLGAELFVLDDGWFAGRNDDCHALGDWYCDLQKLPHGLEGLADKIHAMDMAFGLWIEPEMISCISQLYQEHPDWVLQDPERTPSMGRNQLVLDFSRKEVVDAIYIMLENVINEGNVDYIKWDMNRSLSEVFSSTPRAEQGKVYHQFILGVYRLYEKLIERFPHILFESCASGGARFDPGMLYYAPQAWTSDDTDAVERLKIQYGTSMVYPISSMGSHVSAIPNHQLHRSTPLQMRSDVAAFGTFGYELDPLQLSDEERQAIRKQIAWMKKYRTLIQYGTFYRLRSPFEGGETAWMVVSRDRKQAIVGYYRVLQEVNARYRRLKLDGLNRDFRYSCAQLDYEAYGDELMQAGMIITDSSAGNLNAGHGQGDYISRLYVLNAK